MTTHDQHTEATHSREDIESPAAERLAENRDYSTASADRSTVQTEPTIAEGESRAVAPDSGIVDSQAPARMPEASRTEAESVDDRALFADNELAGLSARWDNVQAGFVDDPRECVQKADGLVSDVVDQLTSGFTAARSRLEEQWARGEEPSTEDLRLALKRYREFFQRLLAV